MQTNRIEKQVLLRAPLARLWSVIGDSKEFGRWFGIDLDGPFAAGRPLTGRIVPTVADKEVAKLQKPYEGTEFEIQVEEVSPPRRLSFGWHPYSVDKGVDYSQEPMTHVALELQEERDGTRLSITESGYERIPEARRAQAYAANEGGWAKQTELIQKYLAWR